MGFDFTESWAETSAVVLLLAGFLAAILLTQAWLVYAVVLLAGFLAGRLFYIKRFKEPIFPFVMMIVGFLFGYLLGNFWASRFWTVVFFVVSFAISYYLHLRKILVIFESEDFVK